MLRFVKKYCRFSLLSLLMTPVLVAFAAMPMVKIRSDLALENRLCEQLKQLDCDCTRNPDPSRRLSWIPDAWIGEGVGTSIDFVATKIKRHNEAETARIVELCNQLPAVRGLSLSLCEPTPEMIEKLAVKHLRVLDLSRTVNVMVDPHMEAVMKNRDLEYLSIRAGLISEDCFRKAWAMPRLRSFAAYELPGAPVTLSVSGTTEDGFTYAGCKMDTSHAAKCAESSYIDLDGAKVWKML